jgi:hypothetical protein
MEQWLAKIRLIRRAAHELEELEAYLDECVASDKLMKAIFSDKPPKLPRRRRTTTPLATE